MRLFIAINFDDTELDAFEAARERLRDQAGAANYSRRENLHLTLAFLGEQPPARMGEISGAMLKATKNTPGFELRFDRAGRFRREGGDIWWLGAAESPELTKLQAGLAAELRARGFKLEDRRYTPHLTLAREVRGEAEPELVLPEPVPALVRGASLMLSERRQGVLTYTPLLFCGFAR